MWSWSLIMIMIETLIKGLKEYKSVCEFNSIDFNVDKVKLYEEVRKVVASMHPSDFGPVEAIKPGKPVKEMTKVEYENYKSMYNDDLKEIKIGYKRTKEKMISIRQDYSKAVYPVPKVLTESETLLNSSCKRTIKLFRG